MRCGFPIAGATSPDILCPVCLAQPPLYDRARAALTYDDLSKPLVLNLKHGGRKDGLRAFSAWMLEAAPFVAEADQILPVPLHWSRLLQRGHNQAGWLAGSCFSQEGWSPLQSATLAAQTREAQSKWPLRQRTETQCHWGISRFSARERTVPCAG
jgi:predicted amidophosphoribosyltransferase